MMAASPTRELLLEVWQPHIIGPAVGVGLGVMAAAMVAAIEQDFADAGVAPKVIFLRVSWQRREP